MSAPPTMSPSHSERLQGRSSTDQKKEPVVLTGGDSSGANVEVRASEETFTAPLASSGDASEGVQKNPPSRDAEMPSEATRGAAASTAPLETAVPRTSAAPPRTRPSTTARNSIGSKAAELQAGLVQRTVAHVKTWYKGHRKVCLTLGAMISGCILLRSSVLVVNMVQKARVNSYLRSLDRDVVHLFVHPRWTHGPNPFPACVAAETFLRLAKVSYTVHFTNDSSMSPNNRLPFIVHNGTVLGESEFIMQYVLSIADTAINRSLSSHAHATGLLAQRLVETSLNYGLSRVTFVDHPNMMADMFAKEYRLDTFVANIIARRMRKATIRQLDASGYGDFSNVRYATEFRRDVVAVESMIASTGRFICGDGVSTYDCTLYAWLQVAGELASCGDETLRYVASSQVIQNYLMRVEELAFPDRAALFTTQPEQHFNSAAKQ